MPLKAGNEFGFDNGDAPRPPAPNAPPVVVENMDARNGLATPVASGAWGLRPTPVVRPEEKGVSPLVGFDRPPNPVGCDVSDMPIGFVVAGGVWAVPVGVVEGIAGRDSSS